VEINDLAILNLGIKQRWVLWPYRIRLGGPRSHEGMTANIKSLLLPGIKLLSYSLQPIILLTDLDNNKICGYDSSVITFK
jgi:hypothetical protein